MATQKADVDGGAKENVRIGEYPAVGQAPPYLADLIGRRWGAGGDPEGRR